MKQRWAVTGAAGFLGSHVVEALLAAGTEVLAIDDFSVGPRAHLPKPKKAGKLKIAKQDITQEAQLTRLFKSFKPTHVVHLAALHFIPAAIANPIKTINLNVTGTQSVLSATVHAPLERFYFASTGDVYAPSEGPYTEDSPQAPFNIYGLTKFMGEKLIELDSMRRPKVHFAIGRLFNLIGPRETNPHFLPEVFKQMKRMPGGPLQLGSTWPRRDMVPVEDAARAIVDFVNVAPAGMTIANIGTGQAISMDALLEMIGALLKVELKVVQDPSRIRPVERPHLQANVSKLKRLIGWVPSADLRQRMENLLRCEGFLN